MSVNLLHACAYLSSPVIMRCLRRIHNPVDALFADQYKELFVHRRRRLQATHLESNEGRSTRLASLLAAP